MEVNVKEFTAVLAFLLFATPAFADVECRPIAKLAVTTQSDDFEKLTVQRPAIKGYAGQWGFVMIEVFGLGQDKARTFGDDNIRAIEACTGDVTTLKYAVRAFPNDSDNYRGHLAEIPVPRGLKDVRIRWCSKAEGGCLDGQYKGGGLMEFDAQDLNKGPMRSVLKK